MSFIYSPHRVRAKVERLLGDILVLKDWLLARDELTQNVRRVLAEKPHFPSGTEPESGHHNYSSLTYERAENGEQAFGRGEAFAYARIGHPLLKKLGDVLKQFDPGAAYAALTAHGMSAVEASFASIRQGDHIVASNFIFSSCRKEIERLKEFGVEVSSIDGRDNKAWEQAIQPNTKLFWFESSGNPTMELIDIEAVSRIAHERGRDILVVVDNSLAFPAQQPLALGADIVVSSLTKTLGLGTDSGGVVLISEEGHQRLLRSGGEQNDPMLQRVILSGLTLSPRVAAVMLERGRIATLPARFARQRKTAIKLAEHIVQNYPEITVNHPLISGHPQAELAQRQMTGSGVFSIDLGSKEKAFAFIDILIGRGIKNVNNFGSPVTSTSHPDTTTHHSLPEQQRRAQGIGPGLVRISVGTERPDYLIGLIDTALKRVTPSVPEGRRISAEILILPHS